MGSGVPPAEGDESTVYRFEYTSELGWFVSIKVRGRSKMLKKLADLKKRAIYPDIDVVEL